MTDKLNILRSNVSIISLFVAVAALPFSISICHGALVVFILTWLLEGDFKEKLAVTKNNLVLTALGLYGIIVLLSYFYSNDERAALFGLERKIFFFLLPVVVATSKLSIDEKLRSSLLKAFCLTCALALLYCFASVMQEMLSDSTAPHKPNAYLGKDFVLPNSSFQHWMHFSYVSLSDAINIHPTYLSLYAGFCMIVMLSLLENERAASLKIVFVLMLLLFALAIVFLSSRIVVFACCVFILVKIINQSKKAISQLFVPFTLLVIIVGGILINPVARYRQLQEVVTSRLTVEPNTNYTNSTEMRVSLWWLGTKAFAEGNVVFGLGLGDVETSIKAISQRFNITNDLRTFDPHSQYLHTLISTGILGLLALSVFFALLFIKAWNAKDILSLALLILFAIVALTECVLEHQKGIAFFSIFVSVMMQKFLRQDTLPLSLKSTSASI